MFGVVESSGRRLADERCEARTKCEQRDGLMSLSLFPPPVKRHRSSTLNERSILTDRVPLTAQTLSISSMSLSEKFSWPNLASKLLTSLSISRCSSLSTPTV